jgi:hypothetical protein
MDMATKVAAAKKAARDIVIVARTDAAGVEGFDAAVERARWVLAGSPLLVARVRVDITEAAYARKRAMEEKEMVKELAALEKARKDREKEEDERRVNTDPLDKKKKKMYEDRMNPYHQVLDHDYPDNCYAEVGRNLKSPEFPVGKIQQTGQKVLTADEYDRDYDSRMRMMNMANMRNDQRQYGTTQGEDETPGNYKKRKNMRGRKGKYYSQVDDEDQTFLE